MTYENNYTIKILAMPPDHTKYLLAFSNNMQQNLLYAWHTFLTFHLHKGMYLQTDIKLM